MKRDDMQVGIKVRTPNGDGEVIRKNDRDYCNTVPEYFWWIKTEGQEMNYLAWDPRVLVKL